MYIFDILQALRIMKALKLKPKRTVRAVFWTAEVMSSIIEYIGILYFSILFHHL